MNCLKAKHLWVLLLCASALAIAGVGVSDLARAQDRAEKRSGTGGLSGRGPAALIDAVKSAPGADFKTGGLAAFESAASRNAQLQSSLEWTFGGKLQHGWGLYAPLIANLIGSDTDVAGRAFALHLALWQQENEIGSTGVLDGDTWSRMIATFQSRRIVRPYTAPGRLTTIPISDCYDPTRDEELRRAQTETFAAYRRMVTSAAADASLGLQVAEDGQLASGEKFLKIISAFRSQEYQDQLRRQSPKSGRAGLAVNSPHSTGRALDLYVGGEPVSTKDENRARQTETPVYRWLVKNAARFGFQPYFYEPWHWEYVGLGG